MSSLGNHPSFISVQHKPQSADPTNPREGDVFRSDGTSRAKGLWEYRDGAWVFVNGVKSLDVFYTEDYSTNGASSLTSGNNATFDNGGVLAGTLVDELVAPIAGTKSIKYTQAAGSLNDWFSSPSIPLDLKQRNTDIGLSLYFQYIGADNDISLVIWDDTNNTLLTSNVDLIKSATTPTRYSTSVYIPSTCLAIKIGFQVEVENIGATLTWDDIELSTNPFVYKNILNSTEWAEYTPTYGTGFGTVTSGSVFYRRLGDTLQVRGFGIVGSVTANPAEISLPTGLSIDTTKLTRAQTVGGPAHILGTWGAADTASSGYVVAATLTSTSNVYLSGKFNGTSVLESSSAVNTIMGGAIAFSYEFEVPIEGWTDTTEHVITPAKNDVNVFSAKISNNGSVASLISQSSPFISSVSRDSTGIVTINFVTDHFTEIPSCTPVPSTTAGNRDVTCYSHELTTSGCKITIENISSNIGQDENFDIMFQRQDADVRNAILLSAIPNNLYSAFYSQSTASIIDQEPSTFVTSFARSGTNNITKTIGISLGLSSAPNVTATPDSRDSTAAAVQYRKDLSTATSLVFETSRTDGNVSDDSFTFFIHKP
jgi:hypothetical protein